VVIDHEFTQRQVPGVEADDVIGTLAARSVDAGYKVII
jgi:5'-3' exonuclease